jgi:colanic acid biosynthesis glycosyl transferase WcaI
MLLFGLTCGWEAFKAFLWKPDVVIVVEPPIACAPAAWFFGRLGGAKLWLHVQDFEVDAALRLDMLRLGILRKVALGVDKFITRRFDRRSTISALMMQKLADKAGGETGNVFFRIGLTANKSTLSTFPDFVQNLV